MQRAHVKLVTIITGQEYEPRITGDLRGLGAHGYTVTPVTGKGEHGARPANMFDFKNVKIEVLCDPKVADRVLQHLETNYLPDEALIAYMIEVDAIPASKFVS